MASMQTRRKRKVGQFLARLRDRSDHTMEEVAALLHRNTSQVSKIENGYNLCAFAELTTLLLFYGATPEEHAEAVGMWEDAKQDSTRIAFSSAVPPKFRAFLRTEADASTVRDVQPCTVPGLLQTGAYATAVRESGHRMVDPTMDANRNIAARLARQKLLHKLDPLRVHALIDEAVIRRVVGNSLIMAEQLRQLVTLGRQDNIVVQVIGYEAGAYGGMFGPVMIFGFEDPEDQDSVYLEHTGGGQWIDNTADVNKFVAMFEDVSALALPAAESAALITARAKALEELDHGRQLAQEQPERSG